MNLNDKFRSFIFSFKKKKKRPVLYQVRRVVFGIRWKLTLLLCIIIILIISILSFIMFNQQKKALRKEKDKKAVALVRLLRSDAEDLLNPGRDIQAEVRRKTYKVVVDQMKKFKKFNKDISAVTVFDINTRIKAHNNPKYYNKYLERKDVKGCLKEEDENKYNFWSFRIRKNNYLSIAYPIFLTKGKLVDVIKDFELYYDKYKDRSDSQRKRLVRILVKKYNINFEEEKPKKRRKGSIKKDSEEIEKKLDMDFFFLNLIRDVLKENGFYLKKKRWLLYDKWLLRRKTKIKQAFEDRKAEEIVEIKEEIRENIVFLIDQLKEFRRLGGLVILFSMDRIQAELNSNIKNVQKVALVMIIVSTLVIFIVVNFIVLNIKRLEKGAVRLGKGDLGVQVLVKSKDELGRLSDVFNLMIRDIKEKFDLEKFVSSSTMEMIKEEDDILLGNIGRRQLAFLFTDIRNFTTYTESNDPKVVIALLNNYFELQSRIIKRHKGDIDDFVGDAVMAHFARKSMIDDAIKAAIDIMKAINTFNTRRKKKDLDTFEIGIGLNFGEVTVGNIGSRERMDFAPIGDAVNLGSRLCSIAPAGTILINEEMLKKAQDKYKTGKKETVSVKGKTQKVKVCELKI
ncbi:MAG: HAMP domain-containing protein [Spirochaetes bacterium]|nr:HAMP domain-containing protein [Spirochaetota bacterium]